MIKVEYTIAKEVLRQNYLTALRPYIAGLKGQWPAHQQFLESQTGNRGLYPADMEDLLIADFDKLNEIYESYVRLRKLGAVDANMHNELKSVFRYSSDNINDALQPHIARFFMDSQNGFKVHTCHYCDTAYVNVYEALAGYPTVLDLVNKASREELQTLVRTAAGGCITDRVVTSIINHRTYHTEADFNSLGYWHNCPDKCETIRQDTMNHFDLDHVLPKGDCPIVALSLFNFVPSCQVCNEKLKRKRTLGNDETQRSKLSPTSDHYDFDNQVTIVLRRRDGGVPKLNCLQHASEYRLTYECKDKDYEKSVGLFRLIERYNYHKVEALRLQDLLSDYSGYITMLHQLFDGNGLGKVYTEDKIREDLFGENFNMSFHRCFGKLHEDIIKAFRARKGVKP